MTTIIQVAHLSNEELLAEIKSLAVRERSATAALVASLAELDERRLYLGEGYSSLFSYCTRALRLSEHAAYGRIEAARAARRFGLILELLAEGAVTLTTICLLAPLLTKENHIEVLESARHKSKRDVEHLVAALRPKPAMPSSARKLPAARASEGPGTRAQAAEPLRLACAEAAPERVPAQSRRVAVVAPIAPAQYKVQITVSADTYEKLRRAQDLLRHTIPNGDPAVIFDRALTLLLTNLEKTKLAAVTGRRRHGRQHDGLVTSRPRSGARCGNGTADSARSWAGTADAPSVVSSSSITSPRMRWMARRQPRIFNSAAARIMRTRASNVSGRCGFGMRLMVPGQSN